MPYIENYIGTVDPFQGLEAPVVITSVIAEIKKRFGLNELSFELMQKVSKITKAQAPAYLEQPPIGKC